MIAGDCLTAPAGAPRGKGEHFFAVDAASHYPEVGQLRAREAVITSERNGSFRSAMPRPHARFRIALLARNRGLFHQNPMAPRLAIIAPPSDPPSGAVFEP
jgi:hypothetical protein